MQSHCAICYTGHLAQESLIVSSSCESSSISLATGRASTMRCLRSKRSTQPPLRARPFIMRAVSGQSNTAPGTQQRLQQQLPSECPIGAGSSWMKSAWLGRSCWGAWITGSDQSNLTPTSSSSMGKANQGKARVVIELVLSCCQLAAQILSAGGNGFELTELYTLLKGIVTCA